MQRLSLQPLAALKAADGSARAPRVLEVACGTGRFATFIRDNHPSAELTLVDLSPFYLEAARENDEYWCKTRSRNSEGRPPPATFVQAAAEALPFEDASFDAVVCVYLCAPARPKPIADQLHPHIGSGQDWLRRLTCVDRHIGRTAMPRLPSRTYAIPARSINGRFHEMPAEARAAAAAEMSRVLAPGGVAVLTDSMQKGDRPVLDSRLKNFGKLNEPHYEDYVETFLPDLFTSGGLTCERKLFASSTKCLSFRKPPAGVDSDDAA